MTRLPARVPPRAALAEPAPQTGLRLAWAASLVLVLALFVLAPHASPREHSGFPAATVLEALLAGEFLALTLWLSLRSQPDA